MRSTHKLFFIDLMLAKKNYYTVLYIDLIIDYYEVFNDFLRCNKSRPKIILTALAIRSITLKGALEGVKYYVKPDFELLKTV